eukprot:Rmarinus@m.27051
MIVSLPVEILEKICLWLPTWQILQVRQSCKELCDALRSPALWRILIYRDFGVHLSASNQVNQARWGALMNNGDWIWKYVKAKVCSAEEYFYACLASSKTLDVVRFRAYLTDGGIEENDARLWFDNLFAPEWWLPYCSESNPRGNCHVIATLPHATWAMERALVFRHTVKERDAIFGMLSRCRMVHRTVVESFPMDLIRIRYLRLYENRNMQIELRRRGEVEAGEAALGLAREGACVTRARCTKEKRKRKLAHQTLLSAIHVHKWLSPG